MNIGTLKVNGFAALAPMAGVADRAMREMCIGYGAGYCISELISAKGVSLGDRKSKALMSVSEKERPIGIQLFGSDPDILAQAVKSAEKNNPDFIDINMGCPAPKVAGNGGGSALLKNPILAESVTKAVVNATGLPVTVKIRTGYDKNNITALEIAKRIENAGASAITVHGRTRDQMYAPPVNLDIIKAVKDSVSIPVIGNGDVVDLKSAAQMYENTGCDYIMIGRAAMGAPWIFSQINAYLTDGTVLPEPPLSERMRLMIKQIQLMREYKGEHIAILEARKHTAWYMKGLRGAAELRRKCAEINCFDDVLRISMMALELKEH